MMGPKVACDRDCGPEGAGFNCGGGADKGDSPPALSLYCIKGKPSNLRSLILIFFCVGNNVKSKEIHIA